MNGRRLLLAIGVVGFVIIMTIAIFSINWGGSGPVVNPTPQVNIADFSDSDVRVRMTIRGEVESDQEHEQLLITVGRDQAVGQLISGYQGNAVRTERTGSNQAAYKTFLSALHNLSFTEEKPTPQGIQYDGACPKGRRITFEFIGVARDDDLPKSLWATTCGKKVGNFDGETTLIRNLFHTQLPRDQYKALTDDTQFR